LARNTGEQALHCLSRLAGDEFTILLVEMREIDDAILVCQRFLDAVREPFHIGEHEIYATCSIGVAVFPADGTDTDTLLKNAGVAMRFSKKQGGNIYHFYSSDLDERSLQFMALQNDLYRAIERKEFQLLYQPQIDIQNGNLVGAEALIRWCHAERGFIPPDIFIPLAEETGLIAQIGEWVFSEACRSIKKWSESGVTVPRIAINVSGRQFREKEFIPTIRKTIDDSGADPQFITVELTESLLMGSAQKNVQMLHEIKDMGFKLSMDDFGTGYSSLSYLSRFPLDELKIDKSFINGVTTSEKNDSTVIVVAIIAMAHSLGLKVVAEGIETPDQLAFLRQHDCDEYQGYLYSKPISFDGFSDLLRKNNVSGSLPLLER
jgi:EAL domain-containing protein (putative c-di-GMP-specific phosphodiesterase class I)